MLTIVLIRASYLSKVKSIFLGSCTPAPLEGYSPSFGALKLTKYLSRDPIRRSGLTTCNIEWELLASCIPTHVFLKSGGICALSQPRVCVDSLHQNQNQSAEQLSLARITSESTFSLFPTSKSSADVLARVDFL
mmetsp:Transcript_7572/g.13932  ORF Transcript_7572/g.13932 Transcript_7572/m.13932 type:complete len:134 (-) Transcript_7572:2698-3099(-)